MSTGDTDSSPQSIADPSGNSRVEGGVRKEMQDSNNSNSVIAMSMILPKATAGIQMIIMTNTIPMMLIATNPTRKVIVCYPME